MLKIVSFVRYSNSSLMLDSNFLLGAVIFFLLCGVLIFQYQIWEDEEYSINKKWLRWKASAIKGNKGDLSRFYPDSEK